MNSHGTVKNDLRGKFPSAIGTLEVLKARGRGKAKALATSEVLLVEKVVLGIFTSHTSENWQVKGKERQVK